MQTQRPQWTDEQVERVVATLLRAGVVLAAAVVLIGAVVYLYRHGHEPAKMPVFEGEPSDLESIHGIVRGAWHGRGRGIIQLGLLLLIATPIARVIFSVYAFGRERDWTYVFVTLFVLAILLYSLLISPSN